MWDIPNFAFVLKKALLPKNESCACACPDGILGKQGVLNLVTSWRWADSV